MSNIEEEVLAAEAARQLLGISRTTMHRLLTSGELRGLKAGAQWRFRRSDLEAYLDRKPHGVSASALPELDVELRWWSDANKERQQEEVDTSATPEEKLAALANQILSVAVARQVSDIHFEPHPKAVLIRFRRDGVLEEARSMPLPLLAPLVRYWKELASLSIEEVHIPQESYLPIDLRALPLRLHLSTLPVANGEALKIGVEPRPALESLQVQLGDLGLPADALQQVKTWLEQPNGLILVVGPIGSGKNTTLATMAAHVNTPDRKVVVFEDPAEMHLPGALQFKFKRGAGVSFASALRAGLSQDPDIIVVGEIKDFPTLELVAQGALTGHLMLSTLSTHSFSQTIQTLNEMGMEPFITSAMLVGILAQRLAPKICPECIVEYQPNAALLQRARLLASEGGYEIPEEVQWKRGAGCSHCRQSGVRGKIPLYEVVSISEEVGEAITSRASEAELDRLARAQNSKSLFAEGAREAVAGRIALDQLFRTLALPSLS